MSRLTHLRHRISILQKQVKESTKLKPEMSLITTIDQFRLASSINVSNTIANWQPYLDDAEEMFIIPAIGKQAFELARDFESADDGTHGAIPEGDSEKSTLQKS